MNEQLPDPSQLSYEQARDELVRIVGKLEAGSAPLGETLKLWERGEALASRCHAILSAAEKRLSSAQQGAEQQAGNGDSEQPAAAGSSDRPAPGQATPQRGNAGSVSPQAVPDIDPSQQAQYLQSPTIEVEEPPFDDDEEEESFEDPFNS